MTAQIERLPWTKERIEALRALHAQGWTGSQIARWLGGVSRNAVIGKLHRLGLRGHDQLRTPIAQRATEARRGRAERAERAKQKRAAPKPEVRPDPKVCVPKPAPDAVVEPDVVFETGLRLEQLPAGACKWPIGVDADGVHVFCGGPRKGEGPYCAHHAAMATTRATVHEGARAAGAHRREWAQRLRAAQSEAA
jgi:GcrA cell cycle regulator